MKPAILLLAVTAAVAMSSCTTAYKSSQTPDDVYYSPAQPRGDEYASTDDRDSRKYYGEDYYEDRYLRMKVRNPYMWSDLDDWYYYGNRYNYSYYNYNYLNNPWTPYTYWNCMYNPYYHGIITVTPRSPYYGPRSINLAVYNVYNNKSITNRNYTNRVYNNNGNHYYPSDNNSPRGRTSSGRTTRTSGDFLRNVFRGSDNNSNSSSNNSSSGRSSSSSSSGSSSSGSSAPVRRF